MGLLTGFTTILVVIGCGAVLAQIGVLDLRSQRTLGEVAFFVASPALMVVTIIEVEISGAAVNLAASAASLATCSVAYAVVARWRWRLDTGSVVIGSLASSYVNAGNLGIAIAAYVVGDLTVVVPTLLVQMLLVQPLAFVVLDRVSGLDRSVGAVLRRLGTNPLTVASVVGVVLAATGWELPLVVDSSLRMLAGLDIPAMLIAYGAALRLSPPVGHAGHNREVLFAEVLKLVVMPVVAWAVGTALGLDGIVLLGVVITAALPTAQNIFLHATRYRTGEDVARETILVTTLCCLPVSLVATLLLA